MMATSAIEIFATGRASALDQGTNTHSRRQTPYKESSTFRDRFTSLARS